jgi:DivIVA domain-containing protein
MAVNERRLTGRDVLNKTFQARTKRGYDPVEVDAYLELIAAQVDMLHGDVATA